MVEVVAYNELGRRIGQTHHRAKLSDAKVDEIRELHEEQRWSYSRIAAMVQISKSAVAMICQYRRRADTVAVWRALKVKRKG